MGGDIYIPKDDRQLWKQRQEPAELKFTSPQLEVSRSSSYRPHLEESSKLFRKEEIFQLTDTGNASVGVRVKRQRMVSTTREVKKSAAMWRYFVWCVCCIRCNGTEDGLCKLTGI